MAPRDMASPIRPPTPVPDRNRCVAFCFGVAFRISVAPCFMIVSEKPSALSEAGIAVSDFADAKSLRAC